MNKLDISRLALTALFVVHVVNGDAVPQTCNLLETQNRITQVVGTTPPYSFVAHLSTTRNYKHQSDKNKQGTAFFIHPRVLLTAGHNVHKYKTWGMVTSEVKKIRLRFGATNGSTNLLESNFPTVQDENIYTNRNFNGKDVDKDYGVIVLPDETAFRKVGGLFTLSIFDPAVLTGLKINIAGYPGNKPDFTQWRDSTNKYFPYRNNLKYDFATSTGVSGAPIWYEEDGAHKVFAIHTNGPAKYNSTSCSTATLITKAIYDDIASFCLKKGIAITEQSP